MKQNQKEFSKFTNDETNYEPRRYRPVFQSLYANKHWREMKKIILYIILLFVSSNLFSQVLVYEENDTLYNWSESGLNLRSTISKKSEIIQTIPKGAILLIDTIFRDGLGDNNFNVELIKAIDYRNKITKSYSINGKMIKIRYKDTVGYVFSGFLSRIKPFDLSRFYNLETILKETYGVVKEFDWGAIEQGNKEIIYNNGIVQRITNGDGWFETSYLIPNITYQEGLLIVSKLFKSKESRETWYLSESSIKIIEFKSVGDMYVGSLQKVNNLIILTINGYN